MRQIPGQFSLNFETFFPAPSAMIPAPDQQQVAEEFQPASERKSSVREKVRTTGEMIAAVAGWADVPPAYKRILISAINTTARMATALPASSPTNSEKPADADLWCCRELNRLLWNKPAAAYGLEERSFQNLVSNLRFILVRLDLHALSYRGKNELSPNWSSLLSRLQSDGQRYGITRFARYCTLAGLDPADVLPDSLENFEQWCMERVLCEDPDAMARRTAFVWNLGRQTISEWPQIEMVRTNRPDHYGIPLEKFPSPFQSDAQAFLATLAEGPSDIFSIEHAFAADEEPESVPPLRRALSASTVNTRRQYIKLAATALIEAGIPIEEMTSLRELVSPIDRVTTILRFHRERLRTRKVAAGETIHPNDLRSNYLGAIAETLRQIGKFHLRLPADQVEKIKNVGSRVTQTQQVTMTERNATRVRALLASDIYPRLINLPEEWMNRANTSVAKPHDRALLALYACALEILLFLPMRRKNLVLLSLDKNLKRPRPGQLIADIVIPGSEVKNKEPIFWPVAPASAQFIEEYMLQYRPLLAQDGNPYLFPGLGINHRNLSEFGTQLSGRVERELGVEFNMHLARHFAVLRYLNRHPGQYEMVSRLLGHKSVTTTIAYYAGLEMDAAARHINGVLLKERQDTAAAAPTFKLRPRSRPGFRQ